MIRIGLSDMISRIDFFAGARMEVGIGTEVGREVGIGVGVGVSWDVGREVGVGVSRAS